MSITDTSEMSLSMITHEIRNPVTLLNSYLQLMAKSHPEVCDFSYWDLIQEEMTHLKALLENISSCQNAMRLHKRSLDAGEYLRNYAASVSPLLSQGGRVTFHFSSERRLPRLSADPDRLRQVLDNLVRNAAEAIAAADAAECAPHGDGAATDAVGCAPHGDGAAADAAGCDSRGVGTAGCAARGDGAAADAAGCGSREVDAAAAPFYIRLHACLRDGFLCISVEDNGCGIPEESLGTLFEPFVTHKPQGTGLGLTICARIAQAHGGTLTCVSGKDPTEFQLLLPAEIRR